MPKKTKKTKKTKKNKYYSYDTGAVYSGALDLLIESPYEIVEHKNLNSMSQALQDKCKHKPNKKIK